LQAKAPALSVVLPERNNGGDCKENADDEAPEQGYHTLQLYTRKALYGSLKKIPKGPFCGSTADKDMLCKPTK
jgi:hypothetical protein